MASSDALPANPEDGTVSVIKMDALVAMKIVQHCRGSELVAGYLLGVDVGEVLEVTSCFPSPSDGSDDGQYQIEMLRCLREVNVDSNTVGWYQSAYMGSHINRTMIESQFNFQHAFPRSVVVIYDPLRTTHGALNLSAIRLTDKFFNMFKKGEFTKDSITAANLSFNDIYESIPIEIVNNGIFRALMHEFADLPAAQPSYDWLDLSSSAFLENNLDMMNLCINDLQQEQVKQQIHQRNLAKAQSQQQAYIQKRKAENAARKAAGLSLLPESGPELEAENPQLFRGPTEPSRLESLIITNQINNHCEEITKFGGQSLTKMYLAKSVLPQDSGK